MSWFDKETKVLFGFVAAVAAIAVIGIKGWQLSVEENIKVQGQRHAVQMECLKSQPPIQCKELP